MEKNKKGKYSKAIMDYLLILGIPSHLRGFNYITYIIEYILEYNISDIKLEKELYKMVAKEYNTRSYSIERDIRYSIEIGYIRTKASINDDVYKNSISFDKMKPSNKQFIMTVVNNIKLDYSSCR